MRGGGASGGRTPSILRANSLRDGAKTPGNPRRPEVRVRILRDGGVFSGTVSTAAGNACCVQLPGPQSLGGSGFNRFLHSALSAEPVCVASSRVGVGRRSGPRSGQRWRGRRISSWFLVGLSVERRCEQTSRGAEGSGFVAAAWGHAPRSSVYRNSRHCRRPLGWA